MTDNVSKIKDRLDIVDVVGSYVKLQKAGINYKGRCPFHNEKTPSFFVTPERQIWHCFGCSKGGDMFEFIKEIEGVEFPEALKILADRAGIELEKFTSAPAAAGADVKEKLFEICELTAKFFEKQFQSTLGKEALEYLKGRGLEEETIKTFRLGFAPDDWQALSDYLISRGYRESEIVAAGLSIDRAKNHEPTAASGKKGIYDRFRRRIMFPIFDISGLVVGFTAREFSQKKHEDNGHNVPSAPAREAVGAPEPPTIDNKGGSGAKYINTPQTLIYDKSRVLYGLSKAKLDIRKADRCILVEGNMDALMSYQAGVRNVVASSGTALTPHHLRLLQRYTKNLGFCFDTDQAGDRATYRGIGLALAQKFNISILEIKDPECKDPADYVKKYARLPAGQGPQWSDLVSQAKPVVDYYFDRARSVHNPTSAEGKTKIIATIAPFVKRLGSAVEKAHWISQLSLLLRVPETAIASDVESFKDDLDSYARAIEPEAAVQTAAVKRAPPEPLQETILSVLLKNPALFRDELQHLPAGILAPAETEIVKQMMAEGPFDFKSFVSRFEGREAMELEFAHLRSQEVWKDFSDEDLKTEFSNLINVAQRRQVNARLASLQFDVKEAEQARDSRRLSELAAEFNKLAKQLTHLHLHQYGQEKTKKAKTASHPEGLTPNEDHASEAEKTG